MKENMNIRELAKKLAVEYKLPRADRYDLYLREIDNKVEVLSKFTNIHILFHIINIKKTL